MDEKTKLVLYGMIVAIFIVWFKNADSSLTLVRTYLMVVLIIFGFLGLFYFLLAAHREGDVRLLENITTFYISTGMFIVFFSLVSNLVIYFLN
jgi:hypothetical protein